ncbi:hypothetical protein AAMO2058_001569800 [Amorphochlora amoebiformis]
MTRGSESKRLNGGTVASPGFRETRVHYVPKPHRGASSNRDVEMSGSVAVELFRVSPEVLKLSLEDRRKAAHGFMKKSGPDGTFPKNSLTKSAEMTFLEEMAVTLFFGVLLGGPVILLIFGIYLFLYGSWLSCLGFVVITAVLAYHPVPQKYQGLLLSKFSISMYRYFSFRFIVEDPSLLDGSSTAWIGASPPHGVLPIANILSMMGINMFCRPFYGAGASVVMNTPFLRYMGLMGGIIDVSSKSIAKSNMEGVCVGIVPDGIAGIFQTNQQDEVVFLKHRMGLAKHALRTGAVLLPAYSVGNTSIYNAWYDKLGIMEALSRKLQMSVLVFWGRFGLPLPYRANVTLLVGKPIEVKKIREDKIERKHIEEIHSKLLCGIEEIFNRHKAACGWEHKNIRFI